jgi:hypothetical protein
VLRRLRFAGYVTVSATTEEELEAACSEVVHAAQQSGMELCRLVGEQDVASTYVLPLGRWAGMTRRPAHRVTTANLQAAYPFIAGGDLGAAGVYIGRDPYGSTFAYDPFLAYEARLIGSPDMVVIGQLGRGKSSLLKSYAQHADAVSGRALALATPP